MLRRSLWRLVMLAALAPFAVIAATSEDASNAPPDTLDATALVKALRAGGLVLYMRHGPTDLNTRDSDRSDLSRCERQRQLSEEGRRQLRAAGEAIRRLGVPIGVVRSSPYCRALETARLVFGRAEADAALTHTIDADAATAKARSAALTALLSTVPQAGTNTVLAGHTGNLMDASNLWPAPEGVTLVFRPEGNGRFRFVARIPLERWTALARSAPR